MLPRGRGIEAVDALQRSLEAPQRLTHRIDHHARQGRGDHRLALPYEQWIVEQLAQPPERMTDCRLGQAQPLARTRDAALRVDGIEDDEQVQVNSR